METAILAGGCFWGMEDLIRKLPGILDTEVGYTGGDLDHASYQKVKTGETGHAEAIRIEFDSNVISYRHILDFFFRIHDPTTKNRQGGDIGTQYRSAIFYLSQEQKITAEEMLKLVEDSGVWQAPLATEITAATKFWAAEADHQDYLEHYPNGYTCHYLRPIPSFLAK
ncbi:MAG: peptide-methionine (S)-S-oxide reductase MsrA [Bdellovibrionales bacterium]|jgi:peptide-methionine (S)-S-oxide reductase|nr:peptide-methionine (S)-S-oxide reductase MsrA [Bdellovibrionales bacterium]